MKVAAEQLTSMATLGRTIDNPARDEDWSPGLAVKLLVGVPLVVLGEGFMEEFSEGLDTEGALSCGNIANAELSTSKASSCPQG